jgi:hypothetical protein
MDFGTVGVLFGVLLDSVVVVGTVDKETELFTTLKSFAAAAFSLAACLRALSSNRSISKASAIAAGDRSPGDVVSSLLRFVIVRDLFDEEGVFHALPVEAEDLVRRKGVDLDGEETNEAFGEETVGVIVGFTGEEGPSDNACFFTLVSFSTVTVAFVEALFRC